MPRLFLSNSNIAKMNLFNKFHLPSTIIIVVALNIAVGLISTARAGEVITVNGHPVDSRTLVYTTPRPGANSRSSILSVTETPSPGGFWKTRKQWKAYWVKDWAIKKIYVPVWKRVWGPTEVREWVPTGVAKPHPGTKHAPIIHRSSREL